MGDYKSKNVMEYLKHITTLSSGSILLLTTFLGEIMNIPEGTFLIRTSIVGFLISIVGAMTTYTITVSIANGNNVNENGLQSSIAGLGLVLAWLGFLIGILSVGIFAFINF